MAGRPKKRKRGLKRVEFRPNRQQPGRRKRFVMPEHDDKTADLPSGESVRAKGDLSRKRTVLDRDVEPDDSLRLRGTAVSVLGQYVEVDDGTRIHLCTIRRILRTRLIEERSPVVVGDEVIFSPIRASLRAPSASEGVGDRGATMGEGAYRKATGETQSPVPAKPPPQPSPGVPGEGVHAPTGCRGREFYTPARRETSAAIDSALRSARAFAAARSA